MRPPAGPHTVAEPQLHSSRGHTESTSNARAPLLDHIKLQSRSRSSTAAPRGHPQRPLPTLAPPRWATYSYKTAAPQQHRVVIRSVPFQRSPPPPLGHIQLQNRISTAAPRSHLQRPPAGPHTAAEQQRNTAESSCSLPPG